MGANVQGPLRQGQQRLAGAQPSAGGGGGGSIIAPAAKKGFFDPSKGGIRGRVGKAGSRFTKSGMGKKMTSLGGKLGKFSMGGMIASIGLGALADYIGGTTGKVISGAANVLGGASTGAMIGSFFGPVGTVVGGVLGGAAGLISSSESGRPTMAASSTLGCSMRRLSISTGEHQMPPTFNISSLRPQ